jgi:hypothetical protein
MLQLFHTEDLPEFLRPAPSFQITLERISGFAPDVRVEDSESFMGKVMYLAPDLRFFTAPRRGFGSQCIRRGLRATVLGSPEILVVIDVDHYLSETQVGVFARPFHPPD